MSIVLALVAAPAFAQDLSLHFLNVGQGDGAVLFTPEGRTVVIDGGKSGTNAVAQLEELGVHTIDLLIASHADYDHSGAHEAILESFDVVTYVTNGLPHTSQSYARIMAIVDAQVAAGELDHRVADAYLPGEDVDDGDADIFLMPPPESITTSSQNPNSIGVVVEYNGFKTLITGDSEQRETDAWLRDAVWDALLADVDVYKAIHHGSADGDAGNTAWMDLVMPEHVVIQVGANSYGHPTQAALDTYDAYAAEVYRNDEDGRVSVSVWSNGAYTLSTEAAGAVVFASSEAFSPVSAYECPSWATVKGNIGSEKVYHLPGGSYYNRTQPEECFVTGSDAEAAGYRRSSR